MKYFKNTMSLEEVKATYRKQAIKLHPDRGGSVEEMTKLNEEFEIAFEVAERFSPAKESVHNYVRQFYTQNGWDGSRYDNRLSTSDVAKKIREYVKYVYPTYKFSVTCSYFAGGSDISVMLMEHPVELTNYDLMKKYMKDNCRCKQWCYIKSLGKDIAFCDLTEEQLDEYVKEELERAPYEDLNNFYIDRETWLNPVVHNVMKDVNNFIKSYHHSDCDGQIDYFDVNFYYTIGIGKWNKPAKLVEKTARITPTKVTKAKRIA